MGEVRKVYICPGCGESFDTKSKAQDCCPVEEQWQCVDCDSIYSYKKDAEEC